MHATLRRVPVTTFVQCGHGNATMSLVWNVVELKTHLVLQLTKVSSKNVCVILYSCLRCLACKSHLLWTVLYSPLKPVCWIYIMKLMGTSLISQNALKNVAVSANKKNVL